MSLAKSNSSRRGGVILFAVILLVVAALVVGGVLLMGARDSGGSVAAGEIVPVERGHFSITIPATGELAALKQFTVRNPLESRSTITEIVDEGMYVEQGAVLFRLAQDELEERIKQAELDELSAKNAYTAADNALAIQISENESEIANAQLRVELARLSLDQWKSGDVERKRLDLQLAVEKADRNLERLTEKFRGSERLFDEGFMSKDDFELDRIAMIEAEANLKTAKLDTVIYENYEYKREEAEKTRELKNTEEDLDRIRRRHTADVERKNADVEKAKGQLDIRVDRRSDLQRQMDLTVVKAPTSGLVVYSSSLSSGHRGNDRESPTVGTELRPREDVMILPDVSQMLASVKVNEALSGLIKPGQIALVYSDASPDTPIQGEVLRVGVLAEGGGWRDPNRRDYTVDIMLSDTSGLGLKPSMRCKAEVRIDEVEDAMYVPVQAVFRKGPVTFVYRPENGGYAEHQVSIGRSSELQVEIIDGLAMGDRVLIREPQPAEIVTKLEIDESQMPGRRGRYASQRGPAASAGTKTDTGAAKPVAPKTADAEAQPRRPRGEVRPSRGAAANTEAKKATDT